MEVYRNRGKCFQLQCTDWALTLRTPGDPEMSQSQPLSSRIYPFHLCLTSKASPSRKLLRRWTSQRREFHRISSHWDDNNNSKLRPFSQVPILKGPSLLPSKSPITVSCHAPVAPREEPGRRPGSSLLPHCQSQPLSMAHTAPPPSRSSSHLCGPAPKPPSLKRASPLCSAASSSPQVTPTPHSRAHPSHAWGAHPTCISFPQLLGSVHCTCPGLRTCPLC